MTYIKFLQRSEQGDALWRTFEELPKRLKDSNPRIFTAVLNAFAATNDVAAAERLVQQMPHFHVLIYALAVASSSCGNRARIL